MALQRPDKIILAMNSLSDGTAKSLKYEDIVVKAFKMFPEDFALRGYPQFPDSSDIHKPLYGPLKIAGYVLTGNKQFRLTQKGLERAKELGKPLEATRAQSGMRLSRDKQVEVDRILKTEAFRLFMSDQRENILDTDFYDYLGVTVRIGRNEFLGRLNTVEEAVKTAASISKDPATQMLQEFHAYLLGKFSGTLNKIRAAK